jgi:hypothetical protein
MSENLDKNTHPPHTEWALVQLETPENGFKDI